MNLFSTLFQFIMGLDKNLVLVIQAYGILVYPLLFLIIFLETGFVITPFLPGDSLLFAAGTIAAKGLLSLIILFFILITAAILGDTVNYWIGSYLGDKVSKSRFVNQEYLKKTHNFYEKYGGKTIIIARFIPIIRTFAPFVAGIGKMSYFRFLAYNIIGGVLWVSFFLFLGFFFGNLPFVKNNFALVIFAIILISLIPAIVEYVRYKTRR